MRNGDKKLQQHFGLMRQHTSCRLNEKSNRFQLERSEVCSLITTTSCHSPRWYIQPMQQQAKEKEIMGRGEQETLKTLFTLEVIILASFMFQEEI